MKIKLDQIIPDPDQPRKTFDMEKIVELQGSTEALGLIQPITVRPCGDDKYMVIVGERRFRAAQLDGKGEIECIIRGDVDSKKAREMQFAENYHVAGLDPVEQYRAWKQHIDAFGLSLAEFSRVTGIDETTADGGVTLMQLAENLGPKVFDIPAWLAIVIAYTISGVDRQREVIRLVESGDIKGHPGRDAIRYIGSQPDRPVADALADFIAGKPNVSEMARTEAIQLARDVRLETPLEKELAAKALMKEARREAEAQLTPEEKEARNAKKNSKKSSGRAKAKEKVERLSLDEIIVLAENLATSDPGRAFQLQAELKKKLDRKDRSNHKLEDVVSVPLPAGKYRSIVIDPPWDIEKIVREERMNQYDFDYPVMSVEEMMSLPVPELATEDGCHVYLWTTQRYLPRAFSLFDAWGVSYVFTMVWHKGGGFQPYGLPQYNCEFVLFGKIGSLEFLETKDFPTCFYASQREHSRKPDEFYKIVGRVSPEPRLDMFGREQREGFTVWGNEANKFKSEVIV